MNLFQLLCSFRGRINRAKYWLTFFIYLAILLVAAFVAYELDMMDERPVLLILLAIIIYIPLLISSIAVGIKRLHDRDKSGWWLLVFYVLPSVFSYISQTAGTILQLIFALASLAISIWAFVELGCLRGTSGDNRFGPDPLAH